MAMKELDRFEKNAKRGVQISTKLLALVGGVILFSCVVVSAVSLTTFDRKQLNATEDSLVATANGAERILVDWMVTLKSDAQLTASSKELQEAVANKDSKQLQAFIKEYGSSVDVEGYCFVGADGTVLNGGASGIFSAGSKLSSSFAVSGALRGTATEAYEPIGSAEYAQIYAAPIRFGGKVVGASVFAYDLGTDDFITVMNRGHDVECTVFSGDTRIATTIPGAKGKKLDNQAILNQVLNQGKQWHGKVTLFEKPYLAVYSPVKNDNGNITGMLFIAKSMEVIEKTRNDTIAVVIPIVIILAVVMVLLSWRFIRWLMWRIQNVTNFLKELETGNADLTKRCKLFIRDEIGDLIIHFDLFMDKLQDIIKQLKDTKGNLQVAGRDMGASTADATTSITEIIANIEGIGAQITNQSSSVNQTADAVNNISSNITSLNGMIEDQSAGVSQASTAVEQMIGNIRSVNTSVDKMASSFETLATDAQTGFTKQQDVNERIKQIENQSEMLQEANQAISSIAEQTNLLAMNAAIEAAHAGEAGKGFSVVADEIRKLSETSSAQSKTIGDQLNKIKDSITEVVAASTESSEAFASVSNKIKETDQLVIQIKAAMEEQNAGSKQIGDALRAMNTSTMEVRNSSTEMSGRNEHIMREMRTLQDVTTSMKQSMDEMALGARKINESGAVLSDISQKVRDSIEKIGKEIDLFKV